MVNETQASDLDAQMIIRFDGVYGFGFYDEGLERNRDPREPWERTKLWHYLRFYPDGQVLHVSTTGFPHEINPWFNLEKYGVLAHRSIGRFQIIGKEIIGEWWHYVEGSPKHRFSFRGRFEGELLIVVIHSDHNNKTYTENFIFNLD